MSTALMTCRINYITLLWKYAQLARNKQQIKQKKSTRMLNERIKAMHAHRCLFGSFCSSTGQDYSLECRTTEQSECLSGKCPATGRINRRADSDLCTSNQ